MIERNSDLPLWRTTDPTTSRGGATCARPDVTLKRVRARRPRWFLNHRDFRRRCCQTERGGSNPRSAFGRSDVPGLVAELLEAQAAQSRAASRLIRAMTSDSRQEFEDEHRD